MSPQLPAPPLRWWGWGERAVQPPPGLARVVREELGADLNSVRPAPSLAGLALPEPSLPAPIRRELVSAVGGFHVRDDVEERVRHAAGRSYLDLLRLRSGALEHAPDAVVHPATPDEAGRVVRACAETGCAVVPFGGGTSVVGGVAPQRAGMRAVIALDLDRLDALTAVDGMSLTAGLGAGMRGPQIESSLGARGLTLGHFPQSFEYATAGGFAATRSAGQASAGYGRFDEVVRGLAMQSPAGPLSIAPLPPHASGPSLLQMVLGSEGTLGVITGVTVQVRPVPPLRHYAAWSLPDLGSGVELLRSLAQRRALPDVARLSDAEETRLSLAMARGRMAHAAGRYLSLRGHARPCLLILGWEGTGHRVGARVRAAAPMLRSVGAITLGEAPARAWLRDRFHGPYLRDALLDHDLLVETLETVCEWSRLGEVRERALAALGEALTVSDTRPLVGSHISHVYADGASLYCTVIARQVAGAERDQWLRAKRAATDAIVGAGGALSHHHGVGRDHVAWMQAMHGDIGVSMLRAVKRELDPAGVMNPAVLLP